MISICNKVLKLEHYLYEHNVRQKIHQEMIKYGEGPEMITGLARKHVDS